MDFNPYLRDDQRELAAKITRRRWRQRFLAGVSERIAAEDTLVFMTLLGRGMFIEAVNIFRSRNLIRRNMDILYGGWLIVGMVPVGTYSRREGPGEIIEIPKDGIPYDYLLRVDPSLEYAAEDVFTFMNEVRELTPRFGSLESALMSFTRKKVCDVVNGNDESSCAICREEMGSQEEVAVLGCRHWFCVDCITSWLVTNHDTCPMCRGKVELVDPAGDLPLLEDDEYYYDLRR